MGPYQVTQKAGGAREFIPSEHVELVFTVFLLGIGLEYLSRHYFFFKTHVGHPATLREEVEIRMVFFFPKSK